MRGSTPRIAWFDTLTSTNALAREQAQAGERGPVWLAAKEQTAGRGRRGRAWSGLDGNLFTTGLYTFGLDAPRMAELSFVSALAVAAVCDHALKAGERVRLKWPNDVLVDGLKTAGILLESGAAPGGGHWLAVGIGINLVAHPADSERPATDLRSAGGTIGREDALEALVEAFETWRRRWTEAGFGPIRDAWLARAHGLGERCEARLDNETVSGVFADLGPDGALRLDLDGGGQRYISAGDVFFPGAIAKG